MKHWTHYRYQEMEQKSGWSEPISMGPGYREFENADDFEDEAHMDCTHYSVSNRLMQHSYTMSPDDLEDWGRLEDAADAVMTLLNSAHMEWIKLDEYDVCLAYANNFGIDVNELYAEIYQRDYYVAWHGLKPKKTEITFFNKTV